MTKDEILEARIQNQEIRLKDLDARIGRLMSDRVSVEEKLAQLYGQRGEKKEFDL